MTLSDHLESLTRSYWESWRTLKLNLGWTLGTDNGSAKMSPYLVHSFDGLDADGQAAFRQDVALVLHAVDALTGEAVDGEQTEEVRQVGPAVQDKALKKLVSALQALDEGDTSTAVRKVRTAFRLLADKPLRPKA